jgi:hypothetical protein
MSKTIRVETDQFIHKDLVAHTKNVTLGYVDPLLDEIPSGDCPITLRINGVDGISLPAGTTEERPASFGAPMLRYNTDTSEYEVYSPELSGWSNISDSTDVSQLSADVASNSSRLDALEYVDIDITSLSVSEGTVFEFDVPATDYSLTFNWVINKTPTTNELESELSATEILPNTATGSFNDTYNITNTTGAELSKWWRLSSTSVAGALSSDDTYTRNVYWVYPYYYGTSVNDYSLSGVEALTKSVSRRGNKTIGMDASDEFIYFAYPASYADLSSIKDGNGFEVIGSFTKHTADVTGASGVAISYKIYKTNSVTTIDQNFVFTY